jgi:hypothetical protein
VFDNCSFVGMNGSTSPLIDGKRENGHVVFNSCWFFDPEGYWVADLKTAGAMNDCFILTGYDSTLATTSPKILETCGENNGFEYNNLTIVMDTGVLRASGSVEALIGVGGVSAARGRTTFDGLTVVYPSTGTIGNAALITANASANELVKIENVFIDFNGLGFPAVATNVFNINDTGSYGNVSFSGFVLYDWAKPAGDVALSCMFNVGNATVEKGTIYMPTSGTAKIGSLFTLSNIGAKIKEVELTNDTGAYTMSFSDAVFKVDAADCEVEEVKNDIEVMTLTSPFFDISAAATRWKVKDCRVEAVLASGVRLARLLGPEGSLQDNHLHTSVDPVSVPVIDISTAASKRQKVTGNHITWNGTTKPAVFLDSNESIVAMNFFYRSAGAIAAIDDQSTGSTVTPNITSTTY